ncbi:hypothetical protein [Bacillus sp. FJAT-50079]|uniref:hypothetical protein n=1 Tax=Bacillus sp. FJAT-50079 TaxID=2833577 RepID=UPI001BC9AEB2|nr:hypothetical protein [Bacillus sp. FJAT-50079]MBS4206763.1 hypothetical protein [Bacillus sp. FJAT-50079]
MIYITSILKGLVHTERSFFQLAKAEEIYGLRWRLCWLFLFGGFVFSLNGWVGIGSHGLSPQLTKLTEAEFAGIKAYFIVGRLLLGLVYTGFAVFFSALWFWTMSDVAYKKLVVMQAFVVPILFVEQLTFLPLAIMHLPWYSSPLSLGVIAQFMTDKSFIIYFFGCLSFLKGWVVLIQYRGLRVLTLKPRAVVIAMVVSLHIISSLLITALASIQFHILLR